MSWIAFLTLGGCSSLSEMGDDADTKETLPTDLLSLEVDAEGVRTLRLTMDGSTHASWFPGQAAQAKLDSAYDFPTPLASALSSEGIAWFTALGTDVPDEACNRTVEVTLQTQRSNGRFRKSRKATLPLQCIFPPNVDTGVVDTGEPRDTGEPQDTGTTAGAPTLVPGPGFDGPTATPPTEGSGPGSDRTAIAHWDAVPFQTFSGTLGIGVLAFHVNGIDRVELSLEGGPWTAVTEVTLNPDTGMEEYWAKVDASTVADGPVEIRAIAYPKAGIPRVLQGTPIDHVSSMIWTPNAGGTLPHAVRHVSTAGSDAGTCGSDAASACATIHGAVASGASGTSLDGLEIRLGEGTWSLPELIEGWMAVYTTENQWLTFTSAEGADPSRVLIAGTDGASDGAGLAVKQTRLHNLTVTQPTNKSPSGFEDYLWYDDVLVKHGNPNAIAEGDCLPFTGYGQNNPYTAVFFTDVVMQGTCNGPTDMILARHVYAEETGGGHSSGTATVLDYAVKTIYGSTYEPGWPDYHGDFYQFYGRRTDVILQKFRVVPGGFISSRGLAGAGIHEDIAIVDVDIETPSPGWVFSFCGNAAYGWEIDHMVIKDSHLVGPSDWCVEGNMTVDPDDIRNVLIDHSVFENGSPEQLPQPWDLPGIRYDL